MANRYHAGIKAGQTNVSADVLLLSSADGSELLGKVAADFTLSYRRQGAARVAVTPVVLAALTTAWAAGGIKEDAGGLYRADYPDAAFAVGADYVFLMASVAGSQVFHERFPLETVGAAEVKVDTAAILVAIDTEVAAILAAVDTEVSGIKTKTDQLTFTTPNTVDASGLSGAQATQLTGIKTKTDQLQFTNPNQVDAFAVSGGALTGPQAADLAAIKAAVDTEVAAIKGKTDQLAFSTPNVVDASGTVVLNPAQAAQLTAIEAKTNQLTFTVPNSVDSSGGTTPAAVATAVWASIVESAGSITAQDAMSIFLSVLAGVSTNGGAIFKSPDGTAVRVQATVNSQKERVVVTLTPA